MNLHCISISSIHHTYIHCLIKMVATRSDSLKKIYMLENVNFKLLKQIKALKHSLNRSVLAKKKQALENEVIFLDKVICAYSLALRKIENKISNYDACKNHICRNISHII